MERPTTIRTYGIIIAMAEEEFIDYYELLGVPTHADPQQIRLAFMQQAKEHHPDVGGSTEYMQQLTMAYRTLRTLSSRRSYDMLYDFKTGKQIIRYQASGTQSPGSSLDDMTDTEIDDFLDTIYNEYRSQPKPKDTLLSRLRRFI